MVEKEIWVAGSNMWRLKNVEGLDRDGLPAPDKWPRAFG
jgi:hypothetical protein